MKFSTYITTTWLLANLIHPIVYRIYFGLPFNWHLPVEMVEFWFWGTFFSLPGYLFGCLIFLTIRNLPVPVVMKLLVLIISAAIGIVLSVWILSFVISARSRLSFFLELSIPSMISAVLSILIRYKQFIQSMSSETYENYLLP
jgi:hypothetical protein